MKPEEIWSIWNEVVDVDMGFDPVPFANAIIDAVPTIGLERISQVLACEIECGIFEQHVAPALDIARKALNDPTQGADMTDAYVGAREDLEDWKRRALEAEDLNRKFMREINGSTHMGEPVLQGADARPVAIYQRQGHDGAWVDTDGIGFDGWKGPTRIVYATRDAAPSSSNLKE